MVSKKAYYEGFRVRRDREEGVEREREKERKTASVGILVDPRSKRSPVR